MNENIYLFSRQKTIKINIFLVFLLSIWILAACGAEAPIAEVEKFK